MTDQEKSQGKSFEEEMAESQSRLEEVLKDVEVGDLTTKGMSVRLGGKIMKFEFVGEEDLPEDEIRREMAEKLTEKLQNIRQAINERMTEFSVMVSKRKLKYEREERNLRKRLAESNLMPEIDWQHARQGLSVVKGSPNHEGSPDTFTWLFQGVYWPKFIDGNKLDPAYSKKMISPITVEIITSSEKVKRVVIRKPIGLGKFQHYHSMGDDSDCWGDWNYSGMPARTPDEILQIGRKACAILENVNSHSPGTENPRGLPRMTTLREHTIGRTEAEEPKVSRADQRIGISPDSERVRGDYSSIWST